MLHLHFSNRYEILTQGLIDQLAQGRGSVFDADQIVVPSEAVRRSLNLAIADHDGICANVQFSFLARWLWQQMAKLLPDVVAESPLAPPVLTWRVDSALADRTFVDAHPRLASYLHNADEVMRFELAQRVAGLLDHYVTYRQDWLADWLTNRLTDRSDGQIANLGRQDDDARADLRWQAALWQRISAELGQHDQHRRFNEALQPLSPQAAQAAGLPASAHVFVLPTMPPLHIELLKQIGRVTELHLYVLNPCREYWFELIDRRRLSHLAARGQAQGHEEGHRLLAAWGKQTQSHVDLLVDHCGEAAEDDSHFEPASADTLLAKVQNAILDLSDLQPGTVALATDDRSLSLHVCHSLTRELEVLQDHLLGLFCKPGLQPSQVLVVTPDLEAAAPLIDAVFGTAPKDRAIPYTVTGRARSSVNTCAQALLALLALAGSRFAASAVFGLLQQASVARRFALDDDTLQQVRDWIRVSGMRWALDAQHRASFGVPPEARHTLGDGLDRLFLGYALPTRVESPLLDLLPAGDAEGSSALALGAFWRFVDALQRLQAELALPKLPADWAGTLLASLETFVQAADAELDDLRELQQTIRTMADTMQRGGVAQPLPLAVVRAALTQLLDDPARGGVPSGRVTFAAISSLRNLPFEVICAIGLNDGVFPSAVRPPEFDLMALSPRRGDRQRRDDERNLFLDLLLAARGSLYLSHVGRSVRDNSLLPPSVLVSELLESVLPAIADDPGSPQSLARARQRLVVEHPLQPFAIEGFVIGGDERLRSFNRELGDALRRSLQALPAGPTAATAPTAAPEIAGLQDDSADDSRDDNADDSDDDGAPEGQPLFFDLPLSAPGPDWREVSLVQLAEFFRNPCRYLLRHRLGMDLQRDAEALLDDEPFLTDLPARSALARRLLPQLLQGLDADALRRLAQAGQEMPDGTLGQRELDRELAQLTAYADRVRQACAEPCLPPHQIAIAIDLPTHDGDGLEPWRLSASLADLRASGLVRSRYDQRRVGDVLEAWLHHLALCAGPAPAAAACTRWLTIDGELRFKPHPQPAAVLSDLLDMYRQGLSRPLHFFPKSAWACWEDHLEAGGSAAAARGKWQVTKTQPYAEGADAAYRLALRGCDEPLDREFFDLAERVFRPLLTHIDDAL